MPPSARVPFALRRTATPFLAGLCAMLVFGLVWDADPYGLSTSLRERAIDALQLAFPRQKDRAQVLVVDIDDRTLASFDGWPLPRSDLSRLLAIINEAHPAVVAFDIFFPGPDRRSARTLADEAARLSNDKAVKRIVSSLPDTDKAFSETIARGSTVLGALATEEGGAAPITNPIGVDGALAPETAAPIGGVAAPLEPLATAALGLGVVSLFGEEGGLVRKAPLVLSAQGVPASGLALEAARIAGKIAMLNITGRRSLDMKPRALTLGEGGALRIRWADEDRWRARTISAADIFEGAVAKDRLAGAAIVIGTSAPEAAALRPTPAGPLTPTVQIQAEALQQLLDGVIPQRPVHAQLIELSAILILGALAAGLATTLGPAAAIVTLLAIIAAWIALAALCLVRQDLVIDPIGPPLAAFIAGNTAAAVAFARTRRLKTLISRRFEQYLSADVVREIVAYPERLRREGETRDITALFTDVEDFTPMTQRLAPQELIALLDVYLENLCRIVTEHGGMVDGIAGDAIHAFFNVPLERVGHVDAAIDCALAIARFSEAFRHGPEAAAAGFGRTRIGVETGPAIVGDVGGEQRLNYTAYGDAVIVAARLEQANKLFDSSICIGPGAAAATRHRLVPLGETQLKGLGAETAVYTIEEAASRRTDPSA